MNNQEKITVIQASSNPWLKPPRVYIIVLIAVVILGATFLTLKNRLRQSGTIPDNKLETAVSPSPYAKLPAAVSGGGERKPSPPPVPK